MSEIRTHNFSDEMHIYIGSKLPYDHDHDGPSVHQCIWMPETNTNKTGIPYKTNGNKDEVIDVVYCRPFCTCVRFLFTIVLSTIRLTSA